MERRREGRKWERLVGRLLWRGCGYPFEHTFNGQAMCYALLNYAHYTLELQSL